MINSVFVTLAGDIVIIVGCVFVDQSFPGLVLGHFICLFKRAILKLYCSLGHFKFTHVNQLIPDPVEFQYFSEEGN